MRLLLSEYIVVTHSIRWLNTAFFYIKESFPNKIGQISKSKIVSCSKPIYPIDGISHDSIIFFGKIPMIFLLVPEKMMVDQVARSLVHHVPYE